MAPRRRDHPDRLITEAAFKGILGTAGDLDKIVQCVRLISDALPARASSRQLLAAFLVFRANAMGQKVTLTDLINEFAHLEGARTSGLSLARTFQTFLEPSRVEPDALGWFEQEVDPDDRRKKYLTLTEAGLEVVLKIRDIMGSPALPDVDPRG